MRTIVQAILWIVLLSNIAYAEQPFWYAGDERVELRIDSSLILVGFEVPPSETDLESFVTSIENIESVVRDEWESSYFVMCALKTGSDFDNFRQSIADMTGVSKVEPVYQSRGGNFRIMTGGIFVKFEASVLKDEIAEINATYGVEIENVICGPTNSYRIKNTSECILGDVELANAYHNLKQTVFAHPDFLLPVTATSYQVYDYYAQYQWHIKKIIGDFNSASVWDFARVDSSITVAVVDQGVAPHEDLPIERLVDGWDFGESRPGGLPYLNFSHGQACAGIIAASHTTDNAQAMNPNTGVISMAPNVKIMPIKIWTDDATWGPASKYANAINYAWENGADIISNSWGFKEQYWDDPPAPGLSDAFYSATLYGRNGLGCAIIFAVGNDGVQDTVPYPASYHTNFAVGAVRQDDSLWVYSNYDSDDHMIDLVAPSGGGGQEADVWTLDLMDTLGANRPQTSEKLVPLDTTVIIYDCPPGANDMDYNCHFSGTSAACPMVAGATALLLSRDPSLPRSRHVSGGGGVYEILRGSAVTNLDWGDITPPDYEYGYGRVDAYRAILSIARGDANNDGQITLGDISLLIDHEFIDGTPIPLDSLLGDVNCDGDVTNGDISILIDHLFIIRLPCRYPVSNSTTEMLSVPTKKPRLMTGLLVPNPWKALYAT